MNLDGFFIALENCYKFATYLWTDLYQMDCIYQYISYLNIVAKSIRWKDIKRKCVNNDEHKNLLKPFKIGLFLFTVV